MLKKKKSLVALLLACLPGACAHLAAGPGGAPAVTGAGDEAPTTPRPLVAELADESSPRLLPDGTLLYVSNQGGDRNLWLRRPGTGWSRRLTGHSADDFDPSPSPDGRAVAFVSKRRDAKGDLYLLRLDGPGSPQRLSDSRHGELEPDWLPDGSGLVFARPEGGIFLLDMQSRSTRRLGHLPGRQPAVSPDGQLVALVAPRLVEGRQRPCLWLHQLAGERDLPLDDCPAPVGFPTWLELNGRRWLVFSRFADDSNGDGAITVDDRPSLWMAAVGAVAENSVAVGPAWPLTDGRLATIQAHARGDRLVWTVHGGSDLDIWTMTVTLPRPGSCRHIAGRAAQATHPLEVIMLLRQRLAFAGGSERLLCQLELAEQLRSWKRYDQAAELYSVVAARSGQDRLRQRAALGLLATEVDRDFPADLDPARREEARPRARRLLRRLERISGPAELRRLVGARLAARVGWFDQALVALASLAASSRPEVAEAALREKAGLQWRLGREGEALGSLLRLAGNVHLPRSARRQAAEQLATWARRLPARQGWPKDYLEVLQRLCRQAGEGEPLASELRLAVAAEQLRRGRLALASQALREAERLAGAGSNAGRALLLLAQVAERRGRIGEALDHVAEIVERHGRHWEVVQPARRLARRLGLSHARRLLAAGEPALAATVLQRLLRVQSDDVAIWREWLAAMHGAGRLEMAAQLLQQRLEQRPEEALSWYLYGLLLTYRDPPRHFDSALEYLQRAAQQDPQAPYLHQTTGWLYEQLARSEDEPEYLLEAVRHYELALSLLSGQEPGARADLQLNLANVYLQLDNAEQAWSFYQQRQQGEVPFRSRRRRQMFLHNSGRAAFLSGRWGEAAERWRQALQLLAQRPQDPRLPRLTAVVGAAWQMAGDHARAAEQFARACRLYQRQGRRRGQARCLRSLGYNLSRAGRTQQAYQALQQARELFGRLQRSSGDRQRIAIGLTSGSSRAPTGFTIEQEIDFIDALLADLSEQAGDWLQAAAIRRRRLANLRTRRERQGDETLWLDVSLEASRLAGLYWQNGFPRLALEFWLPAAAAAAHADSAEGKARLALALLEVARSGWVPIGPALLRRRLQEALDSVSSLPPERIGLAARLAGGLAVALAEQAERELERPLAGAEPQLLLRRGLARLDGSVARLRQALEAAHRAWLLASRVPAGEGPIWQAQAAWNLGQLYRLVGRQTAADDWQRRAEELVEKNGLVELQWRLAAAGGREESAVRLLARLPPDLTGTADSALLRRERDRLLARLVRRAAACEDARAVLQWLDTWTVLRRRDLLWHDLREQAELSGWDLQGWWQRLQRARRKFDELRRRSAGGQQQQRLQQLNEARRSLEAALAGRTLLPARLRRLVVAPPLDREKLLEQLPPGRALLAGVALERQAVFVLATAEHRQLLRLAVGRARLAGLLQDMRGHSGRVAGQARKQLAELLAPVTRAVPEQTDTLVVADGLLELPWESLPAAGGRWGQHLAVVRLSAPADLVDWQQDINVNFAGARWYGAAPSPGVRRAIERLYGSLQVSDALEATGEGMAPGLVVLEGDWLVDRHRPGRSRLRLESPRRGLAGEAPGRLAGLVKGAGLVVLLPRQPVADSAAVACSLDLLARLGRLPHLVVLPAERAPAERALEQLLTALARESPATSGRRARATVGEGLSGAVRLRGHPGLALAARKRLAARQLGQAARQAMGDFRQRRWQPALAGFAGLRALAMFLGRDDVQTAAGKGLVTCAFNLGLMPLAQRAQRQLLELASRRGDRAGRAAALQRLGIIAVRLGQNSRARQRLNEARELYRQLKDRAGEAACLADLALAQTEAADYRRALDNLQEAATLYRRLGRRRQVARMLRLQATTRLRRLHDIAGARNDFQQAQEQLAGLDAPGAAALRLDLARTELAAGNYDLARRLADQVARQARQLRQPALLAEARLEEAKALWYQGAYLQARRVQQQSLAAAGGAGKQRLSISARSLGGLILAELGRLEEAVAELEQALAQARQAGLPDEEATQLNNLGLVERRRGRLDRARQLHEQAEAIDLRLKNLAGRAYDLRNSALVLLSQQQVAEARGRLQRAERISAGLGDRFNRAQALLGLAWVELTAGEHEAAARAARAALEVAGELGVPALAWQAHQALGDAARAMNDTTAARSHYSQALAIVENLPARSGAVAATGYQASRRRLYEDLVHLLLQMGRPRQALEIEERRRLTALAARLRLLGLEAGSGPPGGQQLLAGRLAALERLRADVAGLVERRHGKLAAGTALLVTLVTERDTVVWLLAPSGVKFRLVPRGRAEMQRLVAELIERLEARAPVDERLRLFHRLLLEPFAAELARVRRLGVLADEVLSAVPFAALRNRAGNFLYQARAVFRAPALSLLERRPGRTGDEQADGIPWLLASQADGAELPFARLQLQRLLQRRPDTKLLGREPLAQFAELAPAAERIHLASHGVVAGNGVPGLLLGPGSVLDSATVMGLQLRARLVVLAGCRTARAAAGGEIFSLADAFLLAGSERVLGSLWKVSDVASALLVKRFYRHLEREGVLGAMHRARDTVRRYFPHPAYWAGFTVVGGPPPDHGAD